MENNTLQRNGLAELEISDTQLICKGDWTKQGIIQLQTRLNTLSLPTTNKLQINGQSISNMDTGGGWILLKIIQQLQQQHTDVELIHFDDEYQALLKLLQQQEVNATIEVLPKEHILHAIGRRTVQHIIEVMAFLNFIGELFISAMLWLRSPQRIRWISFLSGIKFTGFSAMGIVALLAFLIGIVLAYQLGAQLKSYGADIYVVDLLGIALLREFAPLLTAIIIAGRTGSAYTAQLGTMKLNEEIDALHTFGLSPIELLVLPRLFALIVALPLLTVLADVFSVVGGMIMSNGMLGIGYMDFISRFGKVVALKNYVIGLIKTPVFAVLIASIGCFQGFQVTGSAESVGQKTTISVVQAIFMIIVADAAFSIIFSKLGI